MKFRAHKAEFVYEESENQESFYADPNDLDLGCSIPADLTNTIDMKNNNGTINLNTKTKKIDENIYEETFNYKSWPYYEIKEIENKVYSNFEKEHTSNHSDDQQFNEFYKNGRYVGFMPVIHSSFNSTVFKGKDLRKNRK